MCHPLLRRISAACAPRCGALPLQPVQGGQSTPKSAAWVDWSGTAPATVGQLDSAPTQPQTKAKHNPNPPRGRQAAASLFLIFEGG